MNLAADPLQRERRRLFAIAYRMLGSAGEAEDAVQDTYLRWYAEPRHDVANPAAFLTTMLTNVCLDELKSARRRREAYPGVWLPEPIADDAAAPGADIAPHAPDPEEDLERLESVSIAFLSMLDALSPLERAVYLLAQVFDYSHTEIGEMLGRSPEATRQVLARARRNLDSRKREPASVERHRELLSSFLSAWRSGDIDGIAALLADDVVSRADGGGYVNAANRPVAGVRAVSKLYWAISRQIPPGADARIEFINGWPSALLTLDGVLVSVLQVRVSGDRIDRVDSVLNPEKLARVARAFKLGVSPTGPIGEAPETLM